VAHYDGINNQGLGDKRHDYNAAGWKDLKNEFVLPRAMANDGKWQSNGFQPLDNGIAFENRDNNGSFPNNYPVGNEARTVEVIFKTPDDGNMFTQVQDVPRGIFAYGTIGMNKEFSVLYRGLTRDACLDINPADPTNNWIFYTIGGNGNNLITCLCSTPSLETPNTINTVTSTYQNNMSDPFTRSYINNILATIVEQGNKMLDTGRGYIVLGGANIPHATFLSVRLYNRVLTAEEIKHNAELDQVRYLSPPEVTIGGKKCTEVVVLSPNHLMCKVPSGDATCPADVTVNGKSYGNVYEYVNPASAFYVSGISPIIGSGGTILTLTGNKLDKIARVEANGKVCQVSGTPNSTTYKCTLPDNPKGETDITITLSDNTVYRFAKVFEYN
jgi:hypothetical protein